MDAVTRAIWSDLSPAVRDLVASEVARIVSELAPPDAGEILHSVGAAAERAAVSETTLRRWISEGRLPPLHIPGRVQGSTEIRVRQADLDAFIRGLAGDRRPTSPHKRRSRVTTTKQSKKAAQPSLDELVRRRVERAGGSLSNASSKRTVRVSGN